MTADYDGRAMDSIEDLRARYPTVPVLRHKGVLLNALGKDDLLRLVAVLRDEWMAATRKKGRHHVQ